MPSRAASRLSKQWEIFMEGFTTMALVFGFGLVNAFLYILMDKWVEDRADAVAGGVARGIPLSIQHRWWNLQIRFVICAGTVTTGLGFLAAGWFMIGRNASLEDARWFAYTAAFINLVGVFGWSVICPIWYRRLQSLLRQAEAD
jgi:hypothetical protein